MSGVIRAGIDGVPPLIMCLMHAGTVANITHDDKPKKNKSHAIAYGHDLIYHFISFCILVISKSTRSAPFRRRHVPFYYRCAEYGDDEDVVDAVADTHDRKNCNVYMTSERTAHSPHSRRARPCVFNRRAAVKCACAHHLDWTNCVGREGGARSAVRGVYKPKSISREIAQRTHTQKPTISWCLASLRTHAVQLLLKFCCRHNSVYTHGRMPPPPPPCAD